MNAGQKKEELICELENELKIKINDIEPLAEIREERVVFKIITPEGNYVFKKFFSNLYWFEREKGIYKLGLDFTPGLVKIEEDKKWILTEHIARPSLEKVIDEKKRRISAGELEAIAVLFRKMQNLSVKIGLRTVYQEALNNFIPHVYELLSARAKNELNNLKEKLDRHKEILTHRDFRPSNIILDKERCYLLDFELYNEDSVAIDIAKFAFSPSLYEPFDCRIAIAKKLMEHSSVPLGFKEFKEAALFWAVCFAGFFRKDKKHLFKTNDRLKRLATRPIELVNELYNKGNAWCR